MHNIRKLTEDLVWVGANDRRIEKFEGVYGLGSGMSYNSYFGDFGKTVLMDTADKAVAKQFFSNLEYCLAGRPLDYVIAVLPGTRSVSKNDTRKGRGYSGDRLA